jgi:hypothetical protein
MYPLFAVGQGGHARQPRWSQAGDGDTGDGRQFRRDPPIAQPSFHCAAFLAEWSGLESMFGRRHAGAM